MARDSRSVARQLRTIAILLVITIISTLLLYRIREDSSLLSTSSGAVPDYFMEDFTTTAMNEQGQASYRLYAIYMAHYPENDTTEVLKPRMEFYRDARPPLQVTADKGWLAADNDVVLLDGNVEFIEKNNLDQYIMRINTDTARILVNQNYAETDDFAEINTLRARITGTGMQANFTNGRLTVLNDVHTIIDPR